MPFFFLSKTVKVCIFVLQSDTKYDSVRNVQHKKRETERKKTNTKLKIKSKVILVTILTWVLVSLDK